MALERSLSRDGKILTIKLDDKFDFGKVKHFKDAYSSDVDNVNQVIVDLVHTEYMDSSALGMLLNMQKKLGDQVNSFRIVNANEKVAKILEISRFDKKFDIS